MSYMGQVDQVLHIMTYTLNSGVKGTVPLSGEQIKEWIEAYSNNKKYVTVIGMEWFGLNSDLVADFKVHNNSSEQREYIAPTQPIVESGKVEEESNQLAVAYRQQSEERLLIQVDCKCGASYEEGLSKYRTKSSCKECNSLVFMDRKVGIVDTVKGKAWYMTNKYYVEREATGI
ncbi:hypothetical protein [Paenibacillus macquariensis]|uniref:Uncharacterized protein n=1 Tax=Paenibacillus macquariensis TaxID=948756 RepID=A0ABY1JKC6_9BACL|nr:hypothetical protein [Paenibacillus macquariensis]MEC0089902.1 hypothetical protein [Paenibacillus macquariensis]SIQ33953.1 hypothetical protein SAMN05421578_101288 [Paenibacillus macquariensis]